MANKKAILNPQDLAALAKLASYPEMEVLWRLLDNRVNRDKNAIISYPEEEPMRLAVRKAFYRGRISAIFLLKREVTSAADKLESLEEKKK